MVYTLHPCTKRWRCLCILVSLYPSVPVFAQSNTLWTGTSFIRAGCRCSTSGSTWRRSALSRHRRWHVWCHRYRHANGLRTCLDQRSFPTVPWRIPDTCMHLPTRLSAHLFMHMCTHLVFTLACARDNCRQACRIHLFHTEERHPSLAATHPWPPPITQNPPVDPKIRSVSGSLFLEKPFRSNRRRHAGDALRPDRDMSIAAKFFQKKQSPFFL